MPRVVCVCVSGLSENSGITVSPLPKEQKVFLLTSSSPPFCGERRPSVSRSFGITLRAVEALIVPSAHHILLELEVSPLDKSAEVEVTLRTGSWKTDQSLRLYGTRNIPYCKVCTSSVRMIPS